jgi:mannose-6-phosphate isomerase-like protein (cupin superfamily)
MKALIRVSPLVLAGVLLCVAAGLAEGGGKAVVWQAGDVKWTPSPAMKGLSIAPLWGDPSQGAYGALKKVAAGTEFGWHTHSSDQKVVAISGTFDFQLEGDTVKQLSAGSYLFVPGGVKHTAKCRAGADCVYFEEQPGKSDYIPATMTAKAPAKKPAKKM